MSPSLLEGFLRACVTGDSMFLWANPDLVLSLRPSTVGFVDGGEPQNTFFPPAYLKALGASPGTMAFHNALDSPDSYAIAWIAALPIERAAAEAMLDEEYAAPTGFTRHQTDANIYTPRIYGTTSAATTASSLLASLRSICVGLLVGIGGGTARPDEGHDIRLGDIVVSQPCGTAGGVCQYDLIKADHERKDSKVPCFLQEMLKKNPKIGKRSKQSPGYAHQGFDHDRLFKALCDHVPGLDCRGCDTAGEVQRDPRDTTDPDIHYGTIVSGNTLVKDAAARDRIVADLGEDCICFELEAVGLMNHFPCLVIRGICDYADSHKNDRWQRYASATAAAYAKELLAKTVLSTTVLDYLAKQNNGLILSFFFDFSDITKQTLDEKPLSQDLLEDIRRKVGDGADGMFRWAFCQLDSLARCRHEVAIEEALVSLPLNINEIYQRMIAIHSKRPLKLAEAKEVIATQIESESRGFKIKRRLFCETDVLDYCPGLVTVVHTTGKELHLAHFSVKEYLLGEYQFEMTTASISIARTCLTYLTDINDSPTEIQQDFPMARYTAEIWTGHAALAQTSEDIVRETVRFLEKEVTFQRWVRLSKDAWIWNDDPGPSQGSRLYYACFYGLIAPARDLIGKGADVNALLAASEGGHQEIVKLLQSRGAITSSSK
ncbi:Pfs NACHT and Ankyrin domain protein [Penicillium alfredii]|uniref:Pfs NACHT and Ankyrin domain protein n=1 Tax=Penicillium alfredii TaxID=1506179 RepID=A0A9W9FK42_9EURO|nr:Pfs NACHT and Ankyrin domain protein [Penicillium alfredii]KAJ5101583.1 Pfs NACHT and Ankyrin domain protein [Penicillium alfredii]